MIRLFPLSLEGKGTANVESLPSYVLRLAHLHAVPAGRLLDSLPCERKVNSANKLLSGSLGSLVRPNSTTQLIVDALGRASSEARSSLRAATFLPLEAAMARSASSFAPHLRWCPLCLTEQVAKSDAPYLKLAWQFLGLKACIHHRMLLQDRCTACGSAQHGWWRKVPLNICDRCDARLDEMPSRYSPNRPMEECAPDLLRLVSEIASTPEPEFPAGGSCRVVRTLIDSLKESGACPDRLAHLDLLEISRYAGDRRMSLPIARRVAFQLSITLPELFSGDITGINHVFGFCLLNQLPANLAPLPREHLVGEHEMYRALLDVVEHSRSTLSLRQVAQRLGVSVGVLRYRFPNEAKQISRGWRQHNARAARMRAGRVRNAVCRCMGEWSALQGGRLTRKGVLRVLRATTDLPKEPLRKEIDSAFMALEVRHAISQRCVRLGIRDPWNRSGQRPEALNTNESAKENFFRVLAWVSESRRQARSSTTACRRGAGDAGQGFRAKHD